MMNKFQKTLKQLEEQGRLRSLRLPGGIDLTSNDYLGFKNHDALRSCAVDALQKETELGSGGSRLLRGHTESHQALEEFAASFFGFERSLFFATGFQANYALFTSLPDRHDVILFDSLIHASAKDGIHASHAKGIKVPHNDLDAYESALKRARESVTGQIWIAVESLYSMDGDFAPLKELSDLVQKYDAVLIVDEAHATGVWGKDGKGLSDSLPKENLIVMHACGKALGVAGGLVCASADVIDYMINTARAFIYSTAPMPLQAILTQESLALVAGAEGEERRKKLHAFCEYTQSKLGGAGSQIVPVLLGEDTHAVAVAHALQEAGYDIRAIRPPTVPEGTARLRLSLSSELDQKTLDDFFSHLLPHLQSEAA